LTSAGRLRCWGYNADYGVGDGTTTNRLTPVDVLLDLFDSDGDGCSDAAELNTDPGSQQDCGFRNPKNPFDYFNPTGDGLNRVDDIVLVLQAYFEDDNDANPGYPPYDLDYNPALDRADDPDYDATQPWRMLQGDGLIRINDIVNAVNVYFHDAR
jgi:hypothetical protein